MDWKHGTRITNSKTRNLKNRTLKKDFKYKWGDMEHSLWPSTDFSKCKELEMDWETRHLFGILISFGIQYFCKVS
ncbi:hypothetical protein CEXT_625491 [Caerostris extrusa]|uniref:Uncharacterized protein n=1 Tax=Caerostris extrusa TaxID=172846 RepID=A0AAV4URI1_CAEEX|nr:hypothetical protein CEXT_625491 [Caerostris extrusa]